MQHDLDESCPTINWCSITTILLLFNAIDINDQYLNNLLYCQIKNKQIVDELIHNI